MSIATKQDLLRAAPQRRFVEVGPLPVSKLTVRIRSLTDYEVSDYQAVTLMAKTDAARLSGYRTANARFIVKCVVDADGNQLLSDADVGQIVANWDAADAAFLYDECARHAGLSRVGVEALQKNSEGGQPEDSSTV